MAIMEIFEVPHPLLRQKSKPVKRIDAEILKLLDDMLDTMYLAPGVGLAAPQVGHLKRMLVLDASSKDEEKHPMFVINPEILWKSDETNDFEEGCLSVPNQFATVTRPKRIKVRYLDRDGTEHTIEADGFLATILQHEIDHLDGKIFTDYLSPLKRRMLLRRLEKERKSASGSASLEKNKEE